MAGIVPRVCVCVYWQVAPLHVPVVHCTPLVQHGSPMLPHGAHVFVAVQ
jgi:hypothetical protein